MADYGKYERSTVGRQYRDALHRTIARRDYRTGRDALMGIASKAINAALSGDIRTIKEKADRLCGKVGVRIELNEPARLSLAGIDFVEATQPNAQGSR